VRWDDFEDACPEIAGIARERFTLDQLVMLGTIRRDGSPRVSPCECDFGAGRLFVSMMWRSMKALDLLRDPRVVVHSVTSNKGRHRRRREGLRAGGRRAGPRGARGVP